MAESVKHRAKNIIRRNERNRHVFLSGGVFVSECTSTYIYTLYIFCIALHCDSAEHTDPLNIILSERS